MAVFHIVFSRFMSNGRRDYVSFCDTIIAGLHQTQGPFSPELPRLASFSGQQTGHL